MPRTNLTEKQYEVFFDILDKIVNSSFGSWQDRRDELIANAGDRDMVNLAEIPSWEIE